MAKWGAWTERSADPYQGTPVLSTVGGDGSFQIMIQDVPGDVILHLPAGTGAPRSVVNTGGAGVIAHLPYGPAGTGGFVATGNDRRLYRARTDSRGHVWLQIRGRGRFFGPVYSAVDLDGAAEILGEDSRHQLAYAYLAPGQRRDEIKQWTDLGKPGEPGGRQGMKGRPAVAAVGERLHVLVRGHDNHLWHLSGSVPPNRERLSKKSFGRWTNLGGALSQVPVVLPTPDGLDCFVVGDEGALAVNRLDGAEWSGFSPLGGQLNGVPAAIHVPGRDLTFVFGRDVGDHLWYRQRRGNRWLRSFSAGDGLTGDPALWTATTPGGGATLTCVVLRAGGALWQRTLTFSAGDRS